MDHRQQVRYERERLREIANTVSTPIQGHALRGAVLHLFSRDRNYGTRSRFPPNTYSSQRAVFCDWRLR